MPPSSFKRKISEQQSDGRKPKKQNNAATAPNPLGPRSERVEQQQCLRASSGQNVSNRDRHTIVGKNTEPIKDEPRLENSQAYAELRQRLVALKNRWEAKTSYDWICGQLRSLRQDLMVQRIQNEFTVQVYETHARIALEWADLAEYNQCQAMLKILYDLGIPGNVAEFTAYNILMLLNDGNKTELNLYVSRLATRQRMHPAVQHALCVRRALSMGNYHALFELYSNAENMSAYIMDLFVERERAKALMIMTRAYQTLMLTFVQNELAFNTLSDTQTYLRAHQAAVFLNPDSPEVEKVLDCKAVLPLITQAYEEKYCKATIEGTV